MSNPREKIQSAREALERSDRAGANAEELRELRKAVGAVVDLVEGEPEATLFPRPIPDVDDYEIVQVLMQRRFARVFERLLPTFAASLAGPVQFSEDDVPTFMLTPDPKRSE